MRIAVQGRSSSLARNRQRQSLTSTPVAGLFDRTGPPTRYARNHSIFGEGEPAEYLYKIASGCARTFKTLDDGRRQIWSFYFPGDIFGLEERQQHSSSAEAVTRCELFAIERKLVMSRAAESNVVISQLLALTNLELERTHSHFRLLLKTAHERVVTFLLEMEKCKNARGDIDLPMIRQDIAAYLGLTVETVSRVLASLESASAISMPTARRIVLCNRSLLH